MCGGSSGPDSVTVEDGSAGVLMRGLGGVFRRDQNNLYWLIKCGGRCILDTAGDWWNRTSRLATRGLRGEESKHSSHQCGSPGSRNASPIVAPPSQPPQGSLSGCPRLGASVTHEKPNSVIFAWMGDLSTQVGPNLGCYRSPSLS